LIINVIFYGFKIPTTIGLIDCDDIFGFDLTQYIDLLFEGLGFVKKDEDDKEKDSSNPFDIFN
jgi:hypothetical protein